MASKSKPRKVIIVENQSLMFAYVLEYSIFTGEPNQWNIVRLKQQYDDPCKVDEIMEFNCDFNEYRYDWECGRTFNAARIIATLDIQKMECTEGFWDFTNIEYALMNIDSGHCSLTSDILNSQFEVV